MATRGPQRLRVPEWRLSQIPDTEAEFDLGVKFGSDGRNVRAAASLTREVCRGQDYVNTGLHEADSANAVV